MSRWVTVDEAAKYLGCSRIDIHVLAKKHNVMTMTTIEKRSEVAERDVKVHYVDLEKLLEIPGIKDTSGVSGEVTEES